MYFIYLFRYIIFFYDAFYPLILLLFDYFHFYMSICVYVNQQCMETSVWFLMEAVSRQTSITVSCNQHIIQVA